ncbi:MAG: iron ABC transporter permease [Chloroflexota bacterium]
MVVALKASLPWLTPSVFLGVFFFYPLMRIFSLSLDFSSLGEGVLARVFPVLGFTVFQASLSTLLTLVIGIPAAFLFGRYSFRGKALLKVLTAIPFMLPTVVVAAGFNAWLGPRGWLNIGLMSTFGLEELPIVFVGTLGAILLAHVFYNTTIILRVVGNAIQHLDPRLEQAARTLGADSWRLFFRVTIPLLLPSILAAALLVFLFDFTSFGVVLLLGGPRFPTLEVEIYYQAVQFFNLPLAAVLSFIQLLCTLAFSILYSRTVIRVVARGIPKPAGENLRSVNTWRQRVFIGGMVALLLLLFLMPLVSLPFRSVARLEAARGDRQAVEYGLTTDYYSELFINRRNSLFYVPPFQAIGNSLTYAAVTVILSLLLGFPAASALARPGRLERLVDPVLMLPLGASAVTLGLGFIVSFNKPPLDLIASPILVPLAHTMIALPFVIRSLQPALASISDRLRQAGASLGASPVRVWLAVEWPIVSRATLAASVFAFTVSLGEFGATALVSRPEYPTLTTAIYRFLSQPGGLNYGQAMAMATILMVITGIGILLIEQLRPPGLGEF